MALASTAAENAALDGLATAGLLAYVALHTASPSTTGANENPATGSYARQACSWNAASGGSKTNSSSLTFSTLGTVPVTHIGTDSAATAGTYGIGAALTAPVTAASITVAAGAITLSAS